jgi:hypothetical protein
MHEHDKRTGVLVLHNQSLDDVMLVETELAGRFGRAAVLDVIVEILGKGNVVLVQENVAGVSRA